MIPVYCLKAFSDNSIFVFDYKDKTFCVDPGDAKVVCDFLKDKGKKLDYILNTHHHKDHIAGNEELKKKFKCLIIAPKKEKIQADKLISEGVFQLDHGIEIESIFSPGHTLFHHIYYFKEENLLFVGDLLFYNGCGRLFEGSMEELFLSLQKLKNFPLKTRLFCAHDYGLKNTRFSLIFEPENKKLQKDLKNIPSKSFYERVSFFLEDQLKTNLFLRTDESGLYKAFKLSKECTELELFTKIRKKRDGF